MMRATPAQRHLGVAAAACLATLLAACGQEQAASPPAIRPVLYKTAEVTTRKVFGPFAGTIQPRYQSSLGFQTSGRMIARDVNVGDLVKKGQRLAALESIVSGFALVQAKADVANAEALLVNASATENRQRILLRGGNTSQAQYDSAEATRRSAEAKLEQSRAALDKAHDLVGYTELHADFDGVVTAWSAEVGQVITSGQTAVTLARPDIREAVFDMPDDLLGTFGQEGAFDVALQSDAAESVKARIREIAPQADAATRTRRLRLALDATPDSFRLGTTVEVSLAETIAPEFKLPASAIRLDGKDAKVWVVNPDGRSLALRDVEILRRSGDEVVLSRGLAAGDKVVTAGVHVLNGHETIKLAEERL